MTRKTLPTGFIKGSGEKLVAKATSGSRAADAARLAASRVLLQLNILQTVVFSDHNTRSVQGINGCDGRRKLSVAVVSFEFLWSSY